MKSLESYDTDAAVAIDHLISMPTCTGRIGTTGMCLGGHVSPIHYILGCARLSIGHDSLTTIAPGQMCQQSANLNSWLSGAHWIRV